MPFLLEQLAAEHNRRVERRRAYYRQWRARHPDANKRYIARAKARNPAAFREKHRRNQALWRAKRPEAYRAYQRHYHQTAQGRAVRRQRAELRKLVTCVECGQQVTRERSTGFPNPVRRTYSLCCDCHTPARELDPVLEYRPVLPDVIADDYEDKLRLEDRLEALETCLAEMSEKRRTIIHQRLLGLSFDEIAERYRVTRQYVCAEELRARRQIRQRLRYQAALENLYAP